MRVTDRETEKQTDRQDNPQSWRLTADDDEAGAKKHLRIYANRETNSFSIFFHTNRGCAQQSAAAAAAAVSSQQQQQADRLDGLVEIRYDQIR